GIMARHIAYQGDRPIFMYGQYYMGVIQAYLGTVLFHLFGASLFSLRLGLVLLNIYFLICMYLLTRLLYSRPFALFIVLLLTFGSYYMLEYQLHAYGGYAELLFFGALMFVIAASLAITSSPLVTWRLRGWHLLGYVVWGCAVGLGVWSDALTLPLIAASGLLIVLFCWRELLRIIPALCILLGLGIGGMPLIIYNLHTAPGTDSFTVLWNLQHGGNHSPIHYTLYPLFHALTSTTLTSIPMITGNPWCPISEEAALQDPTSAHSLTCSLVHAGWGGSYVLLLACACALALWNGWMAWRRAHTQPQDLVLRRELACCWARLFLLVSVLLVLYEYVMSNAPASWPGVEARYLIGLWVAWPVILWPLWRLASPSFSRLKLTGRVGKIVGGVLLAGLLVVYVLGSVMTFADMSRAQHDYQQYVALANNLANVHITHIYTDYWTCDKLAFVSQERVICGVTTGSLRPSHNRVPNYYQIVHADPASAYVFAASSGQFPAVLKLVKRHPSWFHHYVFDGYVVYQWVHHLRPVRSGL
ncbi:MAG TPA: hypothetical protein VHZ51_01885, partial [Ktedonobacteraceae bacterium]|nr:hypothetical protein [Ktedonobacteraceae bacterium]